MSKLHIEKTLIIFKPDALQRGIMGEILTRFERAGLKIVGMKMLLPGQDHYYFHYEDIGKMITRRGEQAFNNNLKCMLEGPVVAAVLEGVEAIAVVRKLVGSTEPKTALAGTIRGDYCHMSYGRADSIERGIPNLIHASGDIDDAEKEIKHWFSESELYDYQVLNEKFTR